MVFGKEAQSNKSMNSLRTFRLTRTLPVALLLATVLSGRTATITWTNVSSANWNNPGNWSPNQVPGGGDTAVFSTPGIYTVLITDNESVSNLVLGAASGTQTFNLSGGIHAVNGAGMDAAQAALNLSGGR